MPRVVNVAVPLPFVLAVAVPLSVAPVGPDTIAAVTTVPLWLTGFPFASSSCTTGCRSEEHTSELQSRRDLVCRLLLEKKKHIIHNIIYFIYFKPFNST